METESSIEKSKPRFPRVLINIILFIGALLWFISPIFVILAHSRCSKTKLGIYLAISYLAIGLISIFVLDFWPTIAAAYIGIWIHINILGTRDPTALAPVKSGSGKGLNWLLITIAGLLVLFLLLAISYYFFSAPPSL